MSLPSLSNDRQTDRPDIVVRGESHGKNVIVFIENKLGSSEGPEQLERYAKQLRNRFHDCEKKFLIYITQYPEEKSADKVEALCHGGVEFRQKRWYEVHRYLQETTLTECNTTLLKDFTLFMEEKKMALKLGLFELSAFMEVRSVQTTLFNIINEAWNSSNFGSDNSLKSSRRGNTGQLKDENVTAWYSSPLTDNQLRVLLGFWFNHNAKPAFFETCFGEFPILFVNLYSDIVYARQRADVIAELKRSQIFSALESESGYKWDDGGSVKGYQNLLFGKSLSIDGISKSDNLADFFGTTFREELNTVHKAFTQTETTSES